MLREGVSQHQEITRNTGEKQGKKQRAKL